MKGQWGRRLFMAAVCSSFGCGSQSGGRLGESEGSASRAATAAQSVSFRGYDAKFLNLPAGATLTLPHGLNARGEVVGASYATPSGPPTAFITDANGENLRALPGLDTALSINDRGDVVGTSQSQARVRLREGPLVSLPKPSSCAACSGEAVGINDSREVIGRFSPQFGVSRGFVYDLSAGTVTMLGDLGVPDFTMPRGINNRGQVVGEAGASDPNSPFPPKRGFVYENGFLAGLDLEGLNQFEYWTPAVDINESGQIVGFANANPHDASHGYLFENGRATFLGAVDQTGEGDVTPRAINNRRQVVGFNSALDLRSEVGFLWQQGASANLTYLVGNLGDFYIADAWDINDVGQIAAVAKAADNSTSRAVLLTPKPEGTAHARAYYNGSTGKGFAPHTEYFDGTISFSTAPGGWIAHCHWDFGDGATAETCWAQHTYRNFGSYTALLTVTDSTGAKGYAGLPVQAADRGVDVQMLINGQPSTPGSITGRAPLTRQFDATLSKSLDPNAWIISYRWDFGDGTHSNAGWVEHTFARGAYTVDLTVTDSTGRTGVKSVFIVAQ